MKPSPNLPKLKSPQLWQDIIKSNHQKEYLWLEDTFFDSVRGIFSSPLSTIQKPQKVTREEFEAWLMSYLTPEALSEIKENLRQADVLHPNELCELFDFFKKGCISVRRVSNYTQ